MKHSKQRPRDFLGMLRQSVSDYGPSLLRVGAKMSLPYLDEGVRRLSLYARQQGVPDTIVDELGKKAKSLAFGLANDLAPSTINATQNYLPTSRVVVREAPRSGYIRPPVERVVMAPPSRAHGAGARPLAVKAYAAKKKKMRSKVAI